MDPSISQTQLTEFDREESQRNYGSVLRDGQTGKPQAYSTAEALSIISQFQACFGKYLCMLNIGLISSLSLLLIPLVSSDSFYIQFTTNDIQMFVSMIYIVMPIGSLISAISFKVKRKPPIILTQAVITASWIGTYFSYKPWHILTARAFGGIAMTISQPQIACYIGEVTTPKLRGIFSNLTQTMGIIGQLIMSNLTYLDNWNMSVIICIIIACLSMLYLFLIPESPILLITQGEYENALISLKRLRGWKWANKKDVDDEFQQLMKNYGKHDKKYDRFSSVGVQNYAYEGDLDIKTIQMHASNNNFPVNGRNNFPTGDTIRDFSMIINNSGHCEPQPRFLEHKKPEIFKNNEEDDDFDMPLCEYLLQAKMWKPLSILIVATFFVVGPGTQGITQYLKFILESMSIDSYYSNILTAMTMAMLAGNLFSTCVISLIGKKRIILISTIGAGLGFIGLGIAHYIKIENISLRVWLLGTLISLTIFLEEFGLRSLYHSLLAELFPMRGKAIGTSLIVLIICANGVIIGQAFPSFLATYGVLPLFSMNSLLSFFGAIFYYFFYTETEGKTLKEIENNF